MFELLERVLSRFKDVWVKMTLNQRVISGAVIVAIIGVAIFLVSLSGNMIQYSLLFAELNPQSASEIVSILEQQNVPYKLTRNGTAIEVPADRVDRLKIDLVTQGLPSEGIVGYEILDTTNFGMSDFLQKVNYQRALMGELRKTLRTLDEIEDANVHLNIPEPTLFTENVQKPTASVTLKLRRGRTLAPSTVQALTNLVGSATGIAPGDVTIVDTRGTLLTKPSMDEMAMLSSTQMEMKVKADQYLAEKVKTILDGAFGAGIALVTVNSELNFDRVERTTTTYSQDTSAILSEEREEETNPTTEGGGREHTVTNYNTGNTVENFVVSPGNISRLTVSVMIDAKDSTWVDENGERQVAKVSWTDAERSQIRTICENAVGYDAGRGDRLEVVALPFGTREYEEAAGERLTFRAAIIDSVQAIGMIVVILVGLLIFYVLLRQIARSLDPSKVSLQIDKILEKEKKAIVEEEEVEVESEKATLIRKIISKASMDPEITAKTIRTIYREGKE
ncbi:flagellar M-ring protein FliF [bacterium]|nr:flagellar M-ring protein FliF [bacterium]